MVLFYNGHRIKNFPYHLCPVTTRILESVPLAGRIAGFNRQQPMSGIPKHSDGNNMWLTCQMGIKVPPPIAIQNSSENGEVDTTTTTGLSSSSAYIRVGPEVRHWKEGQCLLYDTTYEHETYIYSKSKLDGCDHSFPKCNASVPSSRSILMLSSLDRNEAIKS